MPRHTSETTRRELLDAAGTLFRERGLRATGIADIAAAAGYTKATVIYQFHSKDALIREWAAPLLADLADLTNSIDSTSAERPRRDLATDGYVALCVKHRDAVRIIQNELHYVLDQESMADLRRMETTLLEAIAPSDTPAGRLVAMVLIGGVAAAFAEMPDLDEALAVPTLGRAARKAVADF